MVFNLQKSMKDLSELGEHLQEIVLTYIVGQHLFGAESH
jgi:hypothetical protein